MKKTLTTLFIFFSIFSFSQNNPVTWDYAINKLSESEAELQFRVKLEEDFHIYSLNEVENGPIPTAFLFLDENVEKIGSMIVEGELVEKPDPMFGDNIIGHYSGATTFKQKIRSNELNKVNVEVSYQACNSEMCLFPEYLEIVFDLKNNKVFNALDEVDTEINSQSSIIPELPNLDIDNPLMQCKEADIIDGPTKGSNKVSLSILIYFLLGGIIGGLISIFTPCVFPMIPLTVSFFTKKNEGKTGIANAVMYGVFILLIYSSLSIPFHFNSDPALLNSLSTNWILNLVFFLVFIFFAFSLFGFYELKLPSKWASKSDDASNKAGILGIFFMALTLAIVSFSCTGPILGYVLATSLTAGAWPITMALIGFGFALGFPFALCALFPSFLDKLPKSGEWLNYVKVSFGFLELAIAFKFLSTADLVQHWGILPIELFLFIWILVSLGFVLWILGILKFPHDSPEKFSIRKITVLRFLFSIGLLAWTFYLISGFKYNEKTNSFQSLNLLSGLAPPAGYSWIYPSDCPNNLKCYHDFESAKKIAIAENKPMLVDFTGYGCVNCRKMEEHVWSQEDIWNIINDNYILVSLYVDDRKELPKSEQGIVELEYDDGSINKKRIKTIGDKWSAFEILQFKQIAQPYYCLLSPDGFLLVNPIGYTPDKDKYKSWLECGLTSFKDNFLSKQDTLILTTND